LRARQIPNSDIGSSFEQIGQFFTLGGNCISVITQLRLGIKTKSLQSVKRTTLHLRPALKSSGKDIDLGVIFLAKIPLGDRLDCLRNYRI